MIEGEKILYKLFKFIANKKIYNEGVQSTLLLKTNSRSSKQDQVKDKASKQSHWLITFCLKQIVSKRSKTLVIDYQLV